MNNQMRRNEIYEAIQAGERALTCLGRAQERLNSARNWGILDLFGGGFITDIVKHSRMNAAMREIETAKYELSVFQRELRDVNMSINLNMGNGGFLEFADFFFDGLVADYMVQSKIADARRQVEHAIAQINSVLSELYRMYNIY